MKSFLINCLYFGLPVLLAFIGIGFLADGYTDPYYLRYTSARQTCMVLGSSRASLGFQPGIIDSALRNDYPQIHMYNYAFMMHVSPFGKVYFNAIRNKLKQNTRNGVFIIAVEPWAIAGFKGEGEDEDQFREKNYGLGQARWLSANPNYSYLVSGYTKPYLSVLGTKIKTRILNSYPSWKLHEDGWLEMAKPMDSASVAQRMQTTLGIYSGIFLPTCTVSPLRKLWLAKTIAFLKEHGDVYLVRLPVHPSLLVMDNTFYPQFDLFIDSLAREQKTPYFNFSDSCGRYRYIDGSHLTIPSGALVTKELCRLIQNYRREH